MASPVADSYSVASGETIFAGRRDLPSWRKAMSANTWAEVGSNTIADIDPEDDAAINPNHPSSAPWHGSQGLAGAINPWCGGCFDDENSVFWLPLQGGHGDYGGNEPYKIDLSANSPTWEMVRNPSGAVGNEITLADGQEATGLYSDGRLRSIHSYNKCVYIPGTGPALAVTGATYSSGAAGVLKPAIINPETGELATFGAASTYFLNLNASSGLGAAYDPARNAIWVTPANGKKIHYYNITTNAWNWPGVSRDAGGYAGLEYLPDHDCLIWFNSNLTNDFSIYDCSTNTLYDPSITGTYVGIGGLGGTKQPRYCGNNTIAIWDNSTNTTIINTISFSSNPRTDTWQINQLSVAGGNTVTPTAKNSNGTYGRFFYSSKLDGFGVLNAYNQKIYFYARS